jgi:hypothetical protein
MHGVQGHMLRREKLQAYVSRRPKGPMEPYDKLRVSSPGEQGKAV